MNLYKLCNEQLSKQDHYDFGMRAVKSVLVMAGQLKRSFPSLSENVVLIRSLRDSNLPKFLAEDIPLFKGILQDLFPGVEVAGNETRALVATIESTFVGRGLTVLAPIVDRVVQLYDTMQVRHGVMLVGPTGSGKTTSYEILAASLTALHDRNIPAENYQRVQKTVLNPKVSRLLLFDECRACPLLSFTESLI